MKFLILGLGGSLLAGSRQQAAAQEGTPPWAWVEVPELLDGGGRQVIVAAIRRQLVYPPEADRSYVTGRVFISFTITPAGTVRQVKVVKPLWEQFDSAAVKAVRQLRFKPRLPPAGDIRYVVPVSYQFGEPTPTAKKARRRNSTH